MYKKIVLISSILLDSTVALADSLAASLNVYVFPAEGQAADQQSKDEAECYQWAVGNTGVDPFELAKQAEAQKQQAQQQAQQFQ